MNRSTFNAMLAQYSKDESSGDGSVSWENGAHCIIPEVKIGGKVEQVQYSGKNLFDLERRTERTFANSSWSNAHARDFDENSFYRGLTGNGYYDPSTVSNLSISQPNNVLSFDVTKSGYGIGISLRVTPGQVYIAQSEGNAQVAFGVYDESGVYLTWSGNAGMNIITIPDGGFWMTVVVRGTVGYVSAQNIQVELGSTATSYEPYTGGIPTPNPNYPIMPTFSEGTKVVSRGKNLWNMLALKQSTNYYILEVGKDHCVLAGLESGNGFTNTTLTLAQLAPGLVVGRTYTLQFNTESTSTWIYLQQGWNRSWKSGESQVVTEQMLQSIVVLYGRVLEPCIISNIQIEEGIVATPYESYFDGGEAVAPELLAAFDGSCQSLWDPQTGRGLNWWYDMIELDGSETWVLYPVYRGFSCHTYLLPEPMLRNYFWSNFAVDKRGPSNSTEMTIWCGVANRIIYFTFNPFFDDTLPDLGLANWKSHLAEHHLKIWVARNEPIEFQTDPQPLVQPKGYGQLIQTDGTLDDCPITVTPVTHQ